uniref:long-chain specific acyl-CoA dehydrogenase, mitochondrial-like n=1 Tax=Panthera onca TaxID=9690 RepID=UPI0029556804|nr:long-chain specific acyl-CoA dehydrogenase, mitochondrial-like [Panthera onca]
MAARLLRSSLRMSGGRCALRSPPAARFSHSGDEKRLETPSAEKLTDIGTRRIFSSEHDVFRESVRKFFQEEVIPHHAE